MIHRASVEPLRFDERADRREAKPLDNRLTAQISSGDAYHDSIYLQLSERMVKENPTTLRHEPPTLRRRDEPPTWVGNPHRPINMVMPDHAH